MDEMKVFKGGKSLRCGYTTGSCAAAAAKAAAFMLYTKKIIDKVEIDTPKGIKLKLDVFDARIEGDSASCYVIKDAGDDPDITDGVEVYAKVCKSDKEGIEIVGGLGIGIVKRPGLSIEVGKSAINPVPMKMIKEAIGEVLKKGEGIKVEISIPKGVELAHRTYNKRLGIEGGISILGTTGIVEPMSEDAIKDTIALELKSKRALGNKSVILVPGNYGEDFMEKHFGIERQRVVKISNYLGFALEKCLELGFLGIVLAGHIGKLIKPAGGIFYTHSRIADTRMEILAAHLALLGMDRPGIERIMECRTTEEAMAIVDWYKLSIVYEIIGERCVKRCEEYIYDKIDVGVILFSMKELLYKSNKVNKLLEEINE